MYILNYLIALLLPYISLFSKLAPTGTVPVYFFSEQGAFVAGEFGAVIFYWAGYLRNTVANGDLSERQYFSGATVLLIFMCVSKIIFALPFMWITSIFAFGLGVLSAPAGQQNINLPLKILMISSSLVIVGYTAFILVGMAWFDFSPASYHYYIHLIKNWLSLYL